MHGFLHSITKDMNRAYELLYGRGNMDDTTQDFYSKKENESMIIEFVNRSVGLQRTPQLS